MAAAAVSASSTSSRRWLQNGLAHLTATCHNQKTRLTQVSHQAPLRLVPIPSSSIQHAGAALCALSSYGGGMLPGDSHEVHVTVQTNATLGLITQGPTRIYKRPHRESRLSCRSSITLNVANDALFVFGMDPCVPFQNSAFQQSLNVSLEPNASCVLIDWFSAGRLARGEFWDFMSLASRTSLYNQGDDYPFLVESMFLNNELSYSSMDPFGFQRQWNAYASVILHGPQAEPVARRLQDLSLKLTSDYTRVRTMQGLDSSGNNSIVAPQTSGRVLVGVSEIDTHESTFVARVATTCNEDLYRILHACLQPLSPKFGIEFYKDRIHASQTSLPQKNISFAGEASSTNNLQGIHTDNASMQSPGSNETTNKLNMSSESLWNAFMLSDSGLPTGSFAHSAGIEAAAQLGMFQEQHALQDYIQAAIRSSLQLQVPFLRQDYESIDDWSKCDKQLNAYMVSNSVACRASLEQGQGLLRVALSWLRERQAKVDTTGENYAHCISLLQAIQEATTLDDNQGHLAPIFAIVCLSLHVSPKEAYQLLGYCTARDMVSAAVRLSLIGPMAGVSLLDSCWNAVHEGIESARAAHLVNDCDDEHDNGMVHASTCAPIVETIHPCHDILSVRLFRT